ncbi:MAG TPA: hypothetical protein VM262_11295 [Acidimicrobiales bacterium]|nr:hypothetical protein [Acidimicrobiales bacterium]
MTAVEAGSVLETVLVGPFVHGLLRIWRADGTAELLEVSEPAVVGEAVGVGRLARTSPEPSRFREVALFDAASGTLLLMERPRREGAAAGGGDVEAGGVQVATRPAEEPPVDTALWRAAADVIGAAVASAVARGEFVVVEPGGWEPGSEPYALAIVVPGDDGAPVSHVEAVPTPAGDLWPAEVRGPLRAPATASSVSVTGLLLGQAVAAWARSPFNVVLTFGTNPHGPIDVPA